MNSLAATLRAQGDLAGARKLQEETLAIQRRVPGPDHPATLTSMNNLAVSLGDQGDLVGARKLEEETLDIRRRVLGPEHPDTSVSAWWLCLTLEALDERAAARAVLERDLLWLLDRDPATLGADQRNAREYVAKIVDSG
jgi:Tetratricopeptide repeat